MNRSHILEGELTFNHKIGTIPIFPESAMNLMTCPSCGNNLTRQSAVGVKADVCVGGCGGLWIEVKEVNKLNDRLPGQGFSLLFVERADGVHLFRNPEHPCPHCKTTLLYRHCFSRKLEMEIDQCAKCAGFWLDPGTLARLGNDGLEDEQKTILAREYFEEMFDKKVKNMNMVNHDTLEAARQIVRLFLFITPTQYAPSSLPLELL